MLTDTRQSELELFASTVFEPDDWIEVRQLPSCKSFWIKAANLAAQFESLSKENDGGQNIYFGVNPRIKVGDKKGEGVALARCLVADFDGMNCEDAKWKIEGAGLPPPTLMVASGHGCHAYWRLKAPIEKLWHWTQILKELIKAVGSDPAVHDPPRVLRLPGFDNRKKDEPAPVQIVSGTKAGPWYSLASILENLPAIVFAPEPPEQPQLSVNLSEGSEQLNGHSDNDKLFRATKYVNAIPGADLGQRNKAAFKVAVKLRNDFLLDESNSWRLLCGWSSTCRPPLEEHELQAVFESAATNAKKPAGSKAKKSAKAYPFKIGGVPFGGTNSNGKHETEPDSNTDIPITPIPFGQFADENPELEPPVVHQLIRCGETGNLVAPSKTGKSWAAGHLSLCLVTGRPFLDTFDCEPGPVLHIDNELRKSVIAFRIKKIANAMGIQPADYRVLLDVLSLRGRLLNLNQLLELLVTTVKPGTYRAIVVDAWYRLFPPGVSENDNPAVAAMYNAIDVICDKLRCAWIHVHHSSKGNQSEKSVTDTGAGAGAQSRACDSHLILREHQEEGIFVLEGALRSFPPIEPLPLRWEFPLWRPEESIDPTKLKNKMTSQERRQNEKDTAGIVAISKALAAGPATVSKLRQLTKFRAERIQRLLDQLELAGSVTWINIHANGNECRQYEAVNFETKNQ
jgi:hypothetical protein